MRVQSPRTQPERVLFLATGIIFLLSLFFLLTGWKRPGQYDLPRLKLHIKGPSKAGGVFLGTEFEKLWSEGTRNVFVSPREAGISEKPALREPPTAGLLPILPPPDPSKQILDSGMELRNRSLYISPPRTFNKPELGSDGKCDFETRPTDLVWLVGSVKPIKAEIIKIDKEKRTITFRNLESNITAPLPYPSKVRKWEFKIDEKGSWQIETKSAGRDAKKHLALSRECYDCGMEEEARQELETALKLDPELQEAYLLKSAWAEKDGDLDELLGVYLEAKKNLKSSVTIVWRLAEELLKLDMPELALENLIEGFESASGLKFEKLLATLKRGGQAVVSPDAVPLLIRVGEIEFLLGELEESAGLARVALSWMSGDTVAQNLVGLLYLIEGEVGKAEPLLRSASSSGRVETLNNLSALLITLGNLQEAEKLLKSGLAGSPDHPKLRYNLGMVYLRQAKFAEAEKEFRDALKSEPDYELALVGGAVTAQLVGDPARARRLHQRALSVSKANPYSQYGLGLILLEDGKLSESRRRIQNAMLILPGRNEFERALGFVALRSGEFNEALATFESLVRNSGQPASEDYYFLGVARLRLGDLKGARRAFREAFTLSAEKDGYSACALAYLLYQEKKYADAARLFKLAQNLGAPSSYIREALSAIDRATGARTWVENFARADDLVVRNDWNEGGEGNGITFRIVGKKLLFEGVRQKEPGINALLRWEEDGELNFIEAGIKVPPNNDAVVGICIKRKTSWLCLGVRGQNELVWSSFSTGEKPLWKTLSRQRMLNVLLGIEFSDREEGIFAFYANGEKLKTPTILIRQLAGDDACDVGYFSYAEPTQNVSFASDSFKLVYRTRK